MLSPINQLGKQDWEMGLINNIHGKDSGILVDSQVHLS